MSNKSSLVPFLTGDEDQNLHVKMVKNSGKPGLNCTEIASETPDERATRISAAQERLQNRTLDDEKLPKLEQRGVQAKMQSFHRDIAALSSPTCITCMESFPGM